VNIVLAFVLIKFILYPGLGFVLGTNLPIVAVVSESMEHHAGFEEWWSGSFDCKDGSTIIQINSYAQYSITGKDFQDFPFRSGFNKGDIMVLASASSFRVGDVIVYDASRLKAPYPIIHRVISVTDEEIITKGDNNCREDAPINHHQLLGKAVLRVPYLGYIKLAAVEGLCAVHTFGFCLV